MIKTFFIAVLTLALVVAAFVTRPSERSARAFLTGDAAAATIDGPKPLNVAIKDALVKSVDDGQAGVPSGYVFKDRVLWVEVHDADGRSVYTGALAHWFKHEPPAAVPTPASPNAKPDAPLASAKSHGR